MQLYKAGTAPVQIIKEKVQKSQEYIIWLIELAFGKSRIEVRTKVGSRMSCVRVARAPRLSSEVLWSELSSQCTGQLNIRLLA